jgi:hypothetical protein
MEYSRKKFEKEGKKLLGAGKGFSRAKRKGRKTLHGMMRKAAKKLGKPGGVVKKTKFMVS